MEKISYERSVYESVDDESLILGYISKWDPLTPVGWYNRQQNKCYSKMCQIVRKSAVNCSIL